MPIDASLYRALLAVTADPGQADECVRSLGSLLTADQPVHVLAPDTAVRVIASAPTLTAWAVGALRDPDGLQRVLDAFPDPSPALIAAVRANPYLTLARRAALDGRHGAHPPRPMTVAVFVTRVTAVAVDPTLFAAALWPALTALSEPELLALADDALEVALTAPPPPAGWLAPAVPTPDDIVADGSLAALVLAAALVRFVSLPVDVAAMHALPADPALRVRLVARTLHWVAERTDLRVSVRHIRQLLNYIDPDGPPLIPVTRRLIDFTPSAVEALRAVPVSVRFLASVRSLDRSDLTVLLRAMDGESEIDARLLAPQLTNGYVFDRAIRRFAPLVDARRIPSEWYDNACGYYTDSEIHPNSIIGVLAYATHNTRHLIMRDRNIRPFMRESYATFVARLIEQDPDVLAEIRDPAMLDTAPASAARALVDVVPGLAQKVASSPSYPRLTSLLVELVERYHTPLADLLVEDRSLRDLRLSRLDVPAPPP